MQENKNVNTLLKEEKLIDLFGEDLIFTLREILIEKKKITSEMIYHIDLWVMKDVKEVVLNTYGG